MARQQHHAAPVAALAAVLVLARGSTLPDKIYWANFGNGLLQRASLDGTSVEDVLALGENARPVALALEEERCFLYWSGREELAIQRVPIDGSGPSVTFVDLTSDNAHAQTLWRDPVANMLYWSDSNSRLKRTTLDENSAEYGRTEELKVHDSGLSYLERALAMDTSVSPPRAYFSDAQEGRISFADWGTSGGSVVWLDYYGDHSAYLYEPRSVAVDSAGQALYFTDAAMRTVSRVPLGDAGAVAVLARSSSRPVGLVLDVSRGEMYWAERNDDQIRKARLLDGGAIWSLNLTRSSGSLARPAAMALSSGLRSECFPAA